MLGLSEKRFDPIDMLKVSDKLIFAVIKPIFRSLKEVKEGLHNPRSGGNLRLKIHLMKHKVIFHRISEHSDIDSRPFEALGGHLHAMQAHSYPRLRHLSARCPQIGGPKQWHQLRYGFGKTLLRTLIKPQTSFGFVGFTDLH